MISLSEDEWSLCEDYQQYITDKRIPPKEIQGRYMEVMTKIYCLTVTLGGDVGSDSHDDDEG